MIPAKEKDGIIHSIAVEIVDVYGEKIFDLWYNAKMVQIKRLKKLNSETLDRLFDGYLRMKKFERKYRTTHELGNKDYREA